MWYKSEYSVWPLEFDESSSGEYVYVRKNISQQENEDGNVIYVCDEQKVNKKDWELYKKILSHDIEITEVQDALIELSQIISEV